MIKRVDFNIHFRDSIESPERRSLLIKRLIQHLKPMRYDTDKNIEDFCNNFIDSFEETGHTLIGDSILTKIEKTYRLRIP